jgi:hypothetical protein
MRAGLIALVLAACGCNDPVYLAETAPVENMMGMNGFAPASALYVLPVRKPTAAERMALTQEQQAKKLTMPVPWAAVRDFDIEIEYSVHNFETMPVTAFVTVEGGNEFGDYNPAAFINPNANAEQQTPPPPLLAASPLMLAAGATVNGVFREDQLGEAAIDLEAITRYPDPSGVANTPFETILHLSSVSRIGLGGVPANDVTPAMVRYVIGVSADGHVKLDYDVRVRDHNGKLATAGAKNLYVSTAANLAPPVAPPFPPTTP